MSDKKVKDNDVPEKRSQNLNGELRKKRTELTSGQRLYTYVIAIIASLASLQYGYNTTVFSAGLDPISKEFGIKKLKNVTTTDGSESEEYETDTLMQGFLVTTVLIGGLIGALTSGMIADKIGRERTLIIDEIISLISCLGCALTPWLWLLIVSRIVLGLAAGAASVIVPLFVVEIAPSQIRGGVGVLSQLLLTIGIFFAYASGTGFLKIPEKYGWRCMLGLPIIFSIIHLVLSLVFFRVESPKWLLLVNDEEKAKKMLQKLRRTDDIEDELEELEADIGRSDAEDEPSYKELFMNLITPVLPIVLATGLLFWQQITGINAVLYYLATFFVDAGMDEDIANYMSMVVGFINVVMTIVNIVVIDKLGRKPLLLISLTGMIIMHAVISIADLFVNNTTAAGYICAAATILFVMAFAIGLGACPWPIINELFPSQTRALASSAALTVQWITNIVVTLVFPVLIDAVDMGYVFCGFGVLSVAALVFVAILLPETKNKSVDEIIASMKRSRNENGKEEEMTSIEEDG